MLETQISEQTAQLFAPQDALIAASIYSAQSATQFIGGTEPDEAGNRAQEEFLALHRQLASYRMETQRSERAAQEEHDALVLAAQMSVP